MLPVLQTIVQLLFAGCIWIGHPDYNPCPPGPEPPPDWIVYNVNRYQPLYERWQPSFPEIPIAVVKAIIAQESQGINGQVSIDGHASVGLMQIIPRSWTGTAEQLHDPAYNIYRGMWILSSALDQSGGDMLMALALYNCGEKVWEHLTNPMVCGSKGGRFYAIRVLTYYCPLFAENAWDECGNPFTWMDPRGRVQLQGDLEDTSVFNRNMVIGIWRSRSLSWHPL
jgi:hypothetical protein